jgi:D-alanyl-D-alanine carboxypeptidase
MMLPSGNDAAQSLAIHFGLLLLREEFLALCKAQKSTSLGVLDKWQAEVCRLSMANYIAELAERPQTVEAALQAFYREMNARAAELKLKNTHF